MSSVLVFAKACHDILRYFTFILHKLAKTNETNILHYGPNKSVSKGIYYNGSLIC